MRPSTALAASIAATFLLSALPADAGAQDRARERQRQREIERERDRSLDLGSRARHPRERASALHERAREMARAFGGAPTIITAPGAYGYAFGVDDDRAMIGIAMSADGVQDTLGVRVADVTAGGPAASAGLREGDRIVEINGVSLRMSADDARDPATSDIGVRRLEREVRRLKAGDEAELRVLSGTETRTVRVRTVAAKALRPSGADARDRMESFRELMPSREDAERRAALGVSIGATGSRRDTLGLMIMRVTRDGPAERAGLVEGDRIAAINDVEVRARGDDPRDATDGAGVTLFTRELARLAPGDDASLRVYSNGQYRTVRVRTGRASEVNREGGMSFFFDGGEGMMIPSPLRSPGAPGRLHVAPTAPRAPMPATRPLDGRAGPQVRIVRPARPGQGFASPEARVYRFERAAPDPMLRRIDGDGVRRLRTRVLEAPAAVRVQRRVVRI